MFVLGALVLGGIAAVFALWPLFRERAAGIDHREFMRDLYRDRVVELESEQQDAATRGAMREELGAVLLAEADATLDARPLQAKRGKAPILVVALLTVALGYTVYWMVADVSVLDVNGAEEVLALSPDTQRPSIEVWSARLERRVRDRPEDAKSWYLLGHARLKLGLHQQAAEAFAATHTYFADDPTVQMYWLQSRYLASRGRLDDVSAKLAHDILAKDPGNSGVLEILALDAFQQGEAATAIKYLNRALQGTDDLSRQAALGVALRQAREMLDPAPVGLEVEVQTAQSAPQNATVFVIARPPGGGMPYAVVKRPAVMLPFTVTIDDLVAMSDQRTLSSAGDFEILVRLSRSGLAMAQTGDWQWSSQTMNFNALTAGTRIHVDLAPP